MKWNIKDNWIVYTIVLAVLVVIINGIFTADNNASFSKQLLTSDTDTGKNATWVAPSLYTDGTDEFDRKQVIYGRNIIANTAAYFGPKGSIAPITNGMNCQNCHLDAGTREWGNNYGAVSSTYPKFRDRSGTTETIAKRVNDCFERSLNGKALDTTSKEMQAIVTYIKWLGKNVPKGTKPKGSGIHELAYLDRAADPAKGAIVYETKCKSCHGANGEGALAPDNIVYAYPPLWGEHSYNSGAGLYRLSRFAGYVKDNMPYNQATHNNPALTLEEAWDVAAFVNSKPRPTKDLSKDWPDIAKKTIDHPFGPYADGFTEQQHKYGPFKPIVAARKNQSSKK